MSARIRADGRTGGRAVGGIGFGRLVILAVLVPAASPDRATAQGILNKFSSENLRPSAVQLDIGPLGGDNILGTLTGGARLDYGFVAPNVRVLLGLSYFRSDLSSEARRRFVDRLRTVVNDPTNDYTIDLGAIRWSDVTGDLDLQYMLPQGRNVTVYAGMGLGAHVRHASGPAINGTFVQDALNSVTAGLNGTVGVEVGAGRWRLTFDARGVLSSGLSTASVRTGAMYRWAATRARR